jgi:hypothetical protein
MLHLNTSPCAEWVTSSCMNLRLTLANELYYICLQLTVNSCTQFRSVRPGLVQCRIGLVAHVQNGQLHLVQLQLGSSAIASLNVMYTFVDL